MAELKLKKPIMVDGEEKSVIEYDLESLTGADIQQATKELSKAGIMVTTVELDSNYHAAIFAKAAGLMFEDLNRFSAKDYTKATTLVRDFFLTDMAE
jgi:hypothetical protein